MNKFLLLLIFLLLLLYLLTVLLTFNYNLEWYSLPAAQVVALILMMRNGTFMDTRYYKVFRVTIVLWIIGVLFKILHLTGADEILFIALLVAPLVYIAYFISKKNKRLPDVLKVLTAAAYFILRGIHLVNFISSNLEYHIQFIPEILFWLTFAYFVVVGLKNKTLLSH